MTEQEQQEAIAKECGWEHIREEEYPHRWLWRKGEVGSELFDEPPDFLHDLNAMHEAEETLTDSQVQLYIDHLAAVTGAVTIYSKLDLKCTNHWSIYHATAAQRAKAFLRTVGKWKD